VNCMLYMKCGVDSSWYNSGCCRRCVAPWITVLSRRTEFTKRMIYKFTFLWFHKTRHHAQVPVTSGALMHCALSLAARRKDGSTVGLVILLASVCHGDSWVAKHFLHLNLVFQPVWGWGDFGSFQLPQSISSPEGAWNLGGLYLALDEDNSIQLLSIVSNYNGLPYLVSTVWLAQFQKPDATKVWTSSTVIAKQIYSNDVTTI